MAQVLLELNYKESVELSKWLQTHAQNCTLRYMYDNYIPLTERELCGIEGEITQKLLTFLQSEYKSRLKSDVRFE